MKKRAKALSAGFSIGVSAFAIAVLAATSASAAINPLSWHVNKSKLYCGNLPTRTPVEQMYKAACDDALFKMQVDVLTKQTQQAWTAAETARYASSLNWPGPGH
ncbi:hypothetical protein AB0G76_35060 [Streptomyces asoensis]|uniref:Uncharacterized protein n=1 Tax=Streptomyces asoensis TaxID=249586 RepID=A0ABQ3S3Q6_9ACTN|nr:hypothetical protein GCM10010496_51880 [Streptomyces asoensis]GHI62755.1 hypothetical protein Saso_44050 [Streptomyces asoensis]